MTHRIAPSLGRFLAAALLGLAVGRERADAAAESAYLETVKPLLTRACVGCHGAVQPKAGLRLDTAAGARAGGDSGPALRPGDPDGSLLVQVVEGSHPGIDRMPYRRTPLDPADIGRIRRWIADGAAAPVGEPAGVFVHWAFVAPTRPPVPDVPKPTGGPGAGTPHPIDAFIDDGLRRQGLRPSPPADPATWLRRVHLDLVGLPPEPGEVQHFVAHDSPAERRRVVERLLGSPHHGERWGRWWLDIARYADSNGYSIDAPRSIWPYRDAVVAALNADRPFDAFLVEQLAGDLLPGATLAQRVATGFHRNTQINQEGGIDPEQFRIESVFDRVATTGSGLLGLSIGCAQCHDHKFDPVSQRDYYGLFAFFNDQDEPTLELPGVPAGPGPDPKAKPAPWASTLVLSQRSQPRTTRRFVQGDFTRPAEPVEPATPGALPALPGRPAGRASRLDLARWLVWEGNPLTARVLVNRVWQQYFGRGLVETENDFGTQGTPPTHPELLDWLAVEVQASGWSLKHLHRLITGSATYGRSSRARPDLREGDPLNRWLARQNRLRLDAEIIRDVALAASGRLDRTLGGPPVQPPQPSGLGAFTQSNREWQASPGGQRFRRALYTRIQRATLHPALAVFDAPDSFTTCTRRLRSNTPLQALTLLNDAQFHELALELARRMAAGPGPEPERIARAFQRCTARRPAPDETARLLALLRAEGSTGPSPTGPTPPDGPPAAGWVAVARVLLNLDETITRE
ncbi:MAG: PSD1 and planctomycete cytochrome C domain-containing protein [Verrucomicrobiota bacterium]